MKQTPTIEKLLGLQGHESLPPIARQWLDLARTARDQFDPVFRVLAKAMPDIPPGSWPFSVPTDQMGRPYLPIEHFRRPGEGGLCPAGCDLARAPTKIFQSSGTTGQSRSQSRFSADGLATYRLQSCYSFLKVVESLSGGDAGDFLGVSLIPPTKEWPDSSLAQMLAWISDLVPMTYCHHGNLARCVKEAGGRPVWVFGTAFHYVPIIDAGQACPLPRGSLVFETGGTKGRTRDITRGSLHGALADLFAVGDAGIVSEYGMCELAAQAYSCTGFGADDTYRWPTWVEIGVATGPGHVTPTGRGLLTVRDPLRVDYPTAIRTEDLALIKGSAGGDNSPSGAGDMVLLGRVPAAPLKGCSLRAEDDLVASAVEPARVPKAAGRQATLIPVDWQAVASRAAKLADPTSGYRAFLETAPVLGCLEAELGSQGAAASALKDLCSSLPADADGWIDAAAAAVDSGDSAKGGVPEKWLLIAPANHSLAVLQPLLLASLLGLDVTLRVPQKFLRKSGILMPTVAFLAACMGRELKTVAGDAWRLTGENAGQFDAVMVFGDDSTVAGIRAMVGNARVVGFGTRVAIALLGDGASMEDAEAVAKDALALGQSGCMSVRLVVACFDRSPRRLATLARSVHSAAVAFWEAELPWPAGPGLEVEAVAAAGNGFSPVQTDHAAAPLVTWRRVRADGLKHSGLKSWMTKRPFSIPVAGVTGLTPPALVKTLADLTRDWPELGLITMPARWMGRRAVMDAINSAPEGLLFRPLGEANRPRWDGRHEGQPLFA